MRDINRMLKRELVDRLNFRCEHGHNGMPEKGEHPKCYERARGIGERIGFLDIESGGSLDAEWGFTICYRIKPLGGKIIGSAIKPAEVRASLMNGGTKDKRLLERFCKDVWNFDTLVVYYGKDSGLRQRHDIPFLRTRAAKWRIPGFPTEKQMKIVDVYDIIRGKFKLARRRMQDACDLFGIESKASPFVTDIWQDALTGWPKAIEYICKHCDEDVISLEKLFLEVIKYKGTRSTL